MNLPTDETGNNVEVHAESPKKWRGGDELAGLSSRGMHKEMYQELVRSSSFLRKQVGLLSVTAKRTMMSWKSDQPIVVVNRLVFFSS